MTIFCFRPTGLAEIMPIYDQTEPSAAEALEDIISSVYQQYIVCVSLFLYKHLLVCWNQLEQVKCTVFNCKILLIVQFIWVFVSLFCPDRLDVLHCIAQFNTGCGGMMWSLRTDQWKKKPQLTKYIQYKCIYKYKTCSLQFTHAIKMFCVVLSRWVYLLN